VTVNPPSFEYDRRGPWRAFAERRVDPIVGLFLFLHPTKRRYDIGYIG